MKILSGWAINQLLPIRPRVGIHKVLPVGKLRDYIYKAASQSRKVHYLPPYQGKITILLSQLLNIAPAMVGSSYSIELVKAVIAMRSIKEDREIEEIEGVQDRL